MDDINKLPAALSYLWVVLLSAAGGLVGYLQRVKNGKRQFRWFALVTELVTSVFIGVVTYSLCKAGAVSEWMTAALVGLGGHMGTRAIMQLEHIYGRMMGLDGGKTDADGK